MLWVKEERWEHIAAETEEIVKSSHHHHPCPRPTLPQPGPALPQSLPPPRPASAPHSSVFHPLRRSYQFLPRGTSCCLSFSHLSYMPPPSDWATVPTTKVLIFFCLVYLYIFVFNCQNIQVTVTRIIDGGK